LDSSQTNVTGTANILVAIAKDNKELNLVYAGSSTAYGEVPVPHTEVKLPSIQSPYSATKLAGEHLVRSFSVTFGVKATTFRYFQVYGPGQPTSGAYALVTGIFLKQYKEGLPLTIEGDGSQTRDFVHVRDVAKANVLGLKHNSFGLPINIGSGKSCSIKELADMISPNQVHLPPRRIDLRDTLANTNLAENLLGWKAKENLMTAINEMKSI
jgi:UDP-glucose 4-epimerase